GFLVGIVGGSVLYAFLLFVIVFVQDAPNQFSAMRQQLEAADREIANLKDPRDPPSTKRSGPIGPIVAVQISNPFAEITKSGPCKIYVTAPDENKNLRDTLRWIIQYGGGCEIVSPSEVIGPRNADEPPLPRNNAPGIVVRWSEGFAPGDKIV